ncbi:MAG TPA: hypothetical protein VIY72_05685 [Acidimicrobiales bacterium]
MAAPDYVPKPTDEKPRVYTSPPRRPDSWLADRPAEIQGLQPEGPGLGVQGPDQGYALKLARQFEGKLVLTGGESAEDAVAGCMAIATRRASLYGRAPVIHDLTLALNLWGFLSDAAPELVALRKERFAGVASPHHYTECRAIVDSVPENVLRMTPKQVEALVAKDPTGLIITPEPTA